MSNLVIRTLSADDEPALDAFLAPRLVSSIFLASNMRQVGLVDGAERYQGVYVAAIDGAEIVGVAAHYWNGMLILQAPVFVEEIVLNALYESGRKLNGLIGLNEQVGRAKTALGLEGADYQLDESDGLYNLELQELVIPEDLRSGHVQGRRLEPEDLDIVTAWRVAYSVELLGAADSQNLWDESRESMDEKQRAGQSWVLEVDGKVVSNTSFNAAIREVVQVGGVYTPPELRGRGYGRAAVAASLLDARYQGVETAVLFTGDANIPARKAYAALGFQRIGDYRLSILKEPVG